MFADIRSFTHTAEALKDRPGRLADVVNTVLEPLTGIVLARGGVLDKYMGDCVMAFWGALDDDPDPARHALDAARATAAMPTIKACVRAAFADDVAAPTIEIGVGINSGDCVVGNVGCRQRWDYSVLGDAVNLASRLRELCKTYGRAILVGEDAAGRLDGDAARIKVDWTTVRIRSEPQGPFVVAAASGNHAPGGLR